MLEANKPAYDEIGTGYSECRRGDPRLAALLDSALFGMKTVLNVGAGSGSYEPENRDVTAVEPSAEMIAQRPPGAAPVVQASAERLPFPDHHFDAGMSVLSLHHWSDLRQGLAEMRRVSRYRLVLFTFAPETRKPFWLTDDYFPEFRIEDEGIFPAVDKISDILGVSLRVETLPIFHDIEDGFLGAYWRRPRAYLDPNIRRGISSFARRSLADIRPGLDRLHSDLETGLWDQKHGSCRSKDAIDLGYRLAVASF